MSDKIKYQEAFMEMASVFAKTSEANRLKVGCLIVNQGQVISVGVNGTPSGWETNQCENANNETEWFVRHAEVNALNKLRKSTLSSVGADLYVTHSPCRSCALEIIDAKVGRVFYSIPYRDTTGIEMLKSYRIEVTEI